MTNDLITLIANVALSLSFIVGLIFGIAQVRAAARDRRERLTLEAIRNFQTREFAELMHFINSHDMPSSKEQMEMLGMLVAERFISLDLVDKTLGSFVFNSWKKYRPISESLRISIPDPFLNEYFQWLAERIEERMRDQPRKPFHETRRGK